MLRWFGLLCVACAASCNWPTGDGRAFAYSLDVLSSFTGGSDGATPLGGLVSDGHGRLYGTTSAGANGSGTVFGVAPGRKLKTLHAFCSQPQCADGSSPRAGLIADSSGNLYGTTASGGAYGDGTVFELAPNGAQSVLYSFCADYSGGACQDGNLPVAGLAMDSSGTFYGTTTLGGASNDGTVFSLGYDARKGHWKEKVLYSFCSQPGCTDGQTPLAGVVIDTSGNLDGTTQLGGAHGQGTVFRVNRGLGTQKVLYSFCADSQCADGAEPNAGVSIDSKGILYGTTKYGGNPACGDGGGVVFRLDKMGAEGVLYEFCSVTNDADGSYPEAGVILDKKGRLYGTTATGGGSGEGVVFEIADKVERVLYSFCSAGGCPQVPTAGVIRDKSGDIFGTTSAGGQDGFGAVFELTP